MLVSSLALATDNANCGVPQFVPVSEYWRSLYIGRMAFSGVTVKFDVRARPETPALFRHLAGIQEHFIEEMERNHSFSMRMGSTISHSLESEACRTNIALSYTFSSASHEWQAPDDDWRDFSHDREISHGLAWGPRYNPLSSIVLRASWPYFKDGTFIDNAVYSDIDPAQAPHWHVSTKWPPKSDSDAEVQRNTPLSYSVRRFLQVAKDASGYRHWSDLATGRMPNAMAQPRWDEEGDSDGDGRRGDSDSDPQFLAVRAFDSIHRTLTGRESPDSPEPSRPKTSSNPNVRQVFDEEPEPEDRASPRFAAQSNSHSPHVEADEAKKAPEPPSPQSSNRSDPLVFAPRAAPFGSLLSVLVLQMLEMDSSLSAQTAAETWSEFITEVYSHWEQNKELPKVTGATPDLRRCLIHQKLQLLNQCIIRRKRKRAADATRDARSPKKSRRTVDPAEAEEDVDEEEDEEPTEAAAAKSSKRRSSWDINMADLDAAGSDAEPELDLLGGDEADLGWGDLGAVDGEGSSPKIAPREDSSAVSPTSDSSDDWSDAVEHFGGDEKTGGETEEPPGGREPRAMSLKFGEKELLQMFTCWNCEDGNLEHDPARGILREIPGMCLLAHPDRLVNIPQTQEQPLMTSDMLEEQQRILEKLGTSREASLVRAELQGAHLLSDMSAFRAANPCCTLSDFIRWYSPNDWIPASRETNPDESAPHHEPDRSTPKTLRRRAASCVNGQLSARMRDPRSLWHRLWDKSTCHDVSEQAPLFDFETEGTRIIQYLMNLSPPDTLQQLARVAISNAMYIIARTPGAKMELRPLLDSIDEIQHSIRRFEHQHPQTLQESLDYGGLWNWCQELNLLETHAARATALIERFGPGCKRLIEELLRPPHHQSQVLTDEERKIIEELFAIDRDDIYRYDADDRSSSPSSSGSHVTFGRPDVKEFTLFASCPRPAVTSRLVSNRMYVRIQDNQFRIATAFGMSEI